MMRRSAIYDPPTPVALPVIKRLCWNIPVISIVALMAILSLRQTALAQVCDFPPLDDNVCRDAGGSIDSYSECYGKLFEDNAIPTFKAIARCSYVNADNAIRAGLNSMAADVTEAVKELANSIDNALNAENGRSQHCIANLNDVERTLRPFIDAERNALDLDAYRRATYTFSHLSFFTDVLLGARENRATCNAPMQLIKQSISTLSDLKLHHPDYCKIMREHADYGELTKIEELQRFTTIDPDIHTGQLWGFEVTWNSQCGYFDFDNSSADQATIRYTQCPAATLEYKQTLSGLTGVFGWLSRYRFMISAVGGAAVGATVGALVGAGWGWVGGPVGAGAGLLIGGIISGLEAWRLYDDLAHLHALINSEEQKLKDTVAANLITPTEFSDKIDERCTPFQAVVEQRVASLLRDFNAQKHIQVIDNYYTLSDRLHDWYNELFLWATTPGSDGRRFIDDIAEQDLIAQRSQFDQQIFEARATQEVSSRKNALTNIKGTVSLLSCSNLSPSQKNVARSRLRTGLRNFNRVCSTTMDALAIQPDEPIPFASNAIMSDVVCGYKGFRNDVATLELRNGEGFAANMTVRDGRGTVLAQLTNVTSDTDFTQIALPGFVCSSETLQPFGTSAETRLGEATYSLRLQSNIFGFDDADATSLRSAIQALDSQMRFKEVVCTRQLGTAIDVARTADACGIPIPF